MAETGSVPSGVRASDLELGPEPSDLDLGLGAGQLRRDDGHRRLVPLTQRVAGLPVTAGWMLHRVLLRLQPLATPIVSRSWTTLNRHTARRKSGLGADELDTVADDDFGCTA